MSIDTYMTLNKGQSAKYPASDTKITSDTVVNFGNSTANDYAELLSNYATYIRNYGGASGTTLQNSTKVGITYSYANLPVGSYLVLPSISDKVYAVMADNVELTKNSSNIWEISGGSIMAKSSSATIGHTLTYGSSTSSKVYVKKGVAVTGKMTLYIPSYPANTTALKSMKVTLSGSSGDFSNFSCSSLSFVGISKVCGSSFGNSYLQSSTGQNIGSMEIGPDGASLIFTINDISNLGVYSITISYPYNISSSLNSHGVFQELTAKVEFGDPYTSSDTAIKTIKTSKASLATYGLRITGTSGAKFQVKSGSTIVGSNLTINSSGYVDIGGLEAGSYSVIQTTPPSGYTLVNNGNATTVKVGSGGTLVSTDLYGVTLKNSILAALPYTGSVGTILFTIIGALLVIGSIISIIIYKKKNRNLTPQN